MGIIDLLHAYHILDVQIVHYKEDDYKVFSAFGKTFTSPFRLRNEKATIFKIISESFMAAGNDSIEESDVEYLFIGHHKGCILATKISGV